MNNPLKNRPSDTPPSGMDAEKYARLKAEAIAPYRGMRRFFYLAFAASGFVGGFIFLTQLLAGGDATDILPNLAVQTGVVALMGWLLWLEAKAERKQ